MAMFLTERVRTLPHPLMIQVFVCDLDVQSIPNRARMPEANCDGLISDIGLSDGDGWMLLYLLQLPHLIYSIEMSGFGMGADQFKAGKRATGTTWIKPFDLKQLDAASEEASRKLYPTGKVT